MNNKKLGRVVALAGALSLALGACSSGGGDSASSGSSKSSADGPKVSCEVPEINTNGEKVDTSKVDGEITWMTQGLQSDFKEYFEGVIKKFEEENPGTKIKWTDQGGAEDFDNLIATQAQGCKMADVINVPSSTIMALSSRQFLMDLDVKAPGIGDHILPDIYKSAALGKDGNHIAVPWYFGPFVTVYNKEVFERNGLDPNNVPKTMEERFEAGKKIAEAGKGDFALWGNPQWQIAAEWGSMGVKMMNEDNTEFTFAKDPNALKWLESMKEMNDLKVIPPDSFTSEPDPGKAYNKGNLAFGTPNPAFVRNIKNNNAEVYGKTGVAPYPLSEGGQQTVSPQFIAVSVTTKNAPLAVKFAQFITSAEQEFDWARNGGAVIMPPSAEALDKLIANPPEYTSDDLMKQDFEIAVEAAKGAKTSPSQAYLTGQVQNTLSEAVVKAIKGEIEPQTALDNAQAEMNKLIKQLKK
ncbi:MAG: sugar ABC transporter substrate-binding protein [Actinomycetaceae bacterium]|nr:sugar ABC transporter substrate-binding protein [Actinomycetaceae bacterium]